MGYDQRPEQPMLMQFGGLNTRDSELGLPGNDSPFLKNVDLHPVGSIKARDGYSVFGVPFSNKKIDAIMRLEQPEDERGWLYVVSGGIIYRTVYPGTINWETPTSDPDYTALVKVDTTTAWGRANSRYNDGSTEYPSVLYIPRSNGAPLIALGQTIPVEDLIAMTAGVAGTVSPAVTGVIGYPGPLSYDDDHPQWKAGHWPTKMRMLSVGRGSRMHAWGFADARNTVAYSAMNVPFNFIRDDVTNYSLSTQSIDGGYYTVNQGDGDEIISVVDMFSYTVIFKKHSTYIFTGDPGYSDWTMQAQFPVGCVSDRAWVRIGNDIMFWSKDGPRTLSAVQEYGDLAQSSLSVKVSRLVRAILPESYPLICCYHDVTNMRVIWFVPLDASTYNDTAYVYYYMSQTWTKWDGKFCQMMDVQLISSVEQTSELIIGGSYDEGVVVLHSGTADIAVAIDTDYFTNWISFGTVADASRVLWMDVFFGDGGGDVTIEYQTDLNLTWTELPRIIKSFGGGGAVWDRFVWGGASWDETSRSHARYEIDSLFNLIRFRFSKETTVGFEAMGYRLEARMRGPRA